MSDGALDPSHHLAALSPHDDTDSNSNSPILPPVIPLSSPACPKLCFVCGPKSSMEDRWCSSAPRFSDALPPPVPAPVSPSLATANHFTPFFLLSRPTPAPERLSAAVVCPELVPTTQLYLKGPGDLALLACSIILFSFLRLVLSHSLFPALACRWGIRKAGKVVRFGEQGYAVAHRGPSMPSSSALIPSSPFLSPSFLVPPLFLLPPHSFSLCFPSLRLSLPSSLTFFLVPTPLILLTRSMNFRTHSPPPPASSAFNPLTVHFWLDRRWRAGAGVWIAHRQCSTLARSSFLQPRPLFSSAHAHSCVDWRLASAWNGDAGSAGRQSLTCQIVLVPRRSGVLPIRAVWSPCASFLACSRTQTQWGACKKALRWAPLSRALNRVPDVDAGLRKSCVLRS
ncbi:hypothetical protein B0H13DRAFT_2393177 [Mycena leptocephala]|nr:hypothetical protein B0H13DRAFT_2393177 [Mycena leptocephala]